MFTITWALKRDRISCSAVVGLFSWVRKGPQHWLNGLPLQQGHSEDSDRVLLVMVIVGVIRGIWWKLYAKQGMLCRPLRVPGYSGHDCQRF